MKIKTHISIDSAHQLHLPYESKCNNVHGHRWEIDITLIGVNNENGMIIDFSHIKKYFNKYDHVFLNDIIDFETTAETMSKYWATELLKLSENIKGVIVQVAETPNNIAEGRALREL